MTSKTHDIEVRFMRPSDLPKILELVNLEGWNYHISELSRMLTLSPETSIVACKDNAILGGITAVTVDRRCVLGHVVIDGKWRKRGIGSLLINSLIANEEGRGTEMFDVFSVRDAVQFYKRHGFHSVEMLNTYTRNITDEDHESRVTDSRIRKLKGSDVQEMSKLDLSVSGFHREILIERLFQDFPDNSFGIFDEKALRGFIQARFTDVMCDIGPWIMRAPEADDARRLLEALLGTIPIGKKVILGVSERNPLVKRVLEEMGFGIEFYNHRLVRSRREVKPFAADMLAISAFELG